MDISSLTGVGPKTLQKLHSLGIFTTNDLLFYFPRRYIDFTQVKTIRDMRKGEYVTVEGTLAKLQLIRIRGGRSMIVGKLTDATGSLSLYWFNQPYIESQFVQGNKYVFAGKVGEYQKKLCIVSPYTNSGITGKIVPIYPQNKNINSSLLRKLLTQNIPKLLSYKSDYLPPKLLENYQLIDSATALHQIHFPTSWNILSLSKQRLALDELLPILYKK